MIRDYMDAAMAKAEFEVLDDDGTWYGKIPGFNGVWANRDTIEECRTELQEVLEEWLIISISRNLDVPVVEGVDEDSFPSGKYPFMFRDDTQIRIPGTAEEPDEDEIIGVDLLSEILRQAGISREEWEAL